MPSETSTTPLPVAHGPVSELGESPVWDPEAGTVLWVDIPAGIIRTAALLADGGLGAIEEVRLTPPVSAVALTDQGGWLVTTGSRCVLRSSDGGLTALPETPIPDGSRLNDGATDPRGRYLVGSCRAGNDSPGEVLVRLDPGEAVVVDDDLTLSNGIAWSADGTTMYSVDSLRHVVHRRAYDPETGATGARSVWLRIPEGIPDGLCVDEEDHVWIALWGAGEVRRYAPTGEHAGVLRIPAPNPTSVAFAGPDLGTLLITTATEGMSPAEREEHPDAGRVFTARPGVRGLPVPPFRTR